MTYLVSTEDRPSDLTSDRHSNQANSASRGYRFGRISGKLVRTSPGRAAHRARGFFSAMLEAIAAAKVRRIERELRIHRLRYDQLRLDGDRFTRDAD